MFDLVWVGNTLYPRWIVVSILLLVVMLTPFVIVWIIGKLP